MHKYIFNQNLDASLSGLYLRLEAFLSDKLKMVEQRNVIEYRCVFYITYIVLAHSHT